MLSGEESDNDGGTMSNSNSGQVIFKEVKWKAFIYFQFWKQVGTEAKPNELTPAVQNALNQLLVIRKMANHCLELLNNNVSGSIRNWVKS